MASPRILCYRRCQLSNTVQWEMVERRAGIEGAKAQASSYMTNCTGPLKVHCLVGSQVPSDAVGLSMASSA